MASIQGIYIALFGRPADPLGLDYFNEATGNGANLTAIGDLAATAEYQTRFEGMDNAAIVTEIYNSLFGRNPEQAGLAFFVNALTAGTLNINNVAIAILDGAQGEDLETINNKIEAANAFTAAIDTPDELAAYRGDTAAEAGRAFLSPITSDEATIPTAAATDAAIAAIEDGDTPNPGSSFNLTDAVGETITGTAKDDTISGVVDDAGTVNVGDAVKGEGGNDTLNLLVGTLTTNALPAGFTVSGVETVNITYSVDNETLGVLDSSSFAGVKQLWQVDNVNGNADFENVTVGTGVTAGFRSTNTYNTAAAVANTVTAAAGVTSVHVALDGVDTGSSVVFAETTANGVSAVEVSGTIAPSSAAGAAGTLTVGATAADVDSLALALTSKATVSIAATLDDLNTIDATGSTAGITLSFAAAPDELTSAKFGAGADTFSVSTASLGTSAPTLSIDMGAGNDTLTLTATGNAADTATTVTLGAGSDTVAFATLTNVTVAAAYAADLVTIADFNADQDVLDLNAIGVLGRDILSNTELANISGAASLDAAIAAAAAVTTITAYSVFNYGGDAYVLHNVAGAGFEAGDGLVKITGLQVEDLTAQNFIA